MTHARRADESDQGLIEKTTRPRAGEELAYDPMGAERSRMEWVAGVDGCRGGWAAVWLAWDGCRVRRRACGVYSAIEDIVHHPCSPMMVAVDMPIGLLDIWEPGGRLCDRQARQRLHQRASCIFTPPLRSWLTVTSYEAVRGYGMSRQAFHLIPKIRELDRVLTPALQRRVVEAHPELAFSRLLGHPPRENKRTRAGLCERAEALAAVDLGSDGNLEAWIRLCAVAHHRRIVAPDDMMDALVLAWTALQVSRGRGIRLPEQPPRDARGLRMEIWM